MPNAAAARKFAEVFDKLWESLYDRSPKACRCTAAKVIGMPRSFAPGEYRIFCDLLAYSIRGKDGPDLIWVDFCKVATQMDSWMMMTLA